MITVKKVTVTRAGKPPIGSVRSLSSNDALVFLNAKMKDITNVAVLSEKQLDIVCLFIEGDSSRYERWDFMGDVEEMEPMVAKMVAYVNRGESASAAAIHFARMYLPEAVHVSRKLTPVT